MGWRSWNNNGVHITQAKMLAQGAALADASRGVSLRSLGYKTVGMDDGWQLCGSYGPENYTYHRTMGAGGIAPVVNTSSFPDMRGLVDALHAQGLLVGWYGANCACRDHCGADACYAGDVAALVEFGFDAIKIDGCGNEGQNHTPWFTMLNASAKSADLIIEVNGGAVEPHVSRFSVPFHLFRVAHDIRPTYDSVVWTANFMKRSLATNTTGPGAWAYADMLEVGVTAQWPHADEDEVDDGGGGAVAAALPPVLTTVESATHFALWCVLSQPLTLSLDLTDAAIVDAMWPIIANAEAIDVDQAWDDARGAGGVLFESATNVTLPFCSWGDSESCTLPAQQQFYKPLPGGGAAVIVLNHANTTLVGARVEFAAVPLLACAAAPSCAVRDITARADAGTFVGAYPVPDLAPHASAFVRLS